jgi:fumarate hydratase class II
MTVAGMQGNFELNLMIPVMAATLLESIELLSTSMTVLADRCIAGIEADRERCRDLADRTLAVATALNEDLGYERVEQIVKEAHRTGDSVRTVARRSGVGDDVLDRALDLDRIARGDRR